MSKKKDILNLVAFCILMESGKGIVSKSPDYMLEKLRRFWGGEDNEWMWGLDRSNFEKLKRWAKKWQGRDLDKEIKKFEIAEAEQEALEAQAEAEWEAQQRAEAEWEAMQAEQMRAEWEAGQAEEHF